VVPGVVQIPPFSAMPTADSRISLGPVYRSPDNSVSSKVKPFAQPFVQDQDLPQVDLKGYSVEELAAAANVTVDVIQAAIKLRQQQLLVENQKYANLIKQKTTNFVTVRTTPATTTVSTTSPPLTTKASIQVPKRKVMPNSISHKVRTKPRETSNHRKQATASVSHSTGHECAERVLSSRLRQKLRRQLQVKSGIASNVIPLWGSTSLPWSLC
jgi:hypothetical protein